MTRLNTTYLGMKLRSPIVVSACTLSEEVDNIVRMEDAGAGAVVMFSMFEEQIRKEEMRMEAIMQSTNNVFAEASDFFPDLDEYHVATAQYLETVRMAKERVKIPIIGSLNGITPKGWIDYAKQLEQAGADALEVNIFYIPADIRLSGVDVEQRYLDIIKLVKQTVKIPIAVKMNPYFSAMAVSYTHLAASSVLTLSSAQNFIIQICSKPLLMVLNQHLSMRVDFRRQNIHFRFMVKIALAVIFV